MERNTSYEQFASNIAAAAPHIDLGMNGKPDAGDASQPNVIYAVGSNISRFIQDNFQQSLTDYSLGWTKANPLVAEILEHVAPKVNTPKRFEYGTGTQVEGFLSETDDFRGIGADFKRVEYTSGKTTTRTYNKGLFVRIDIDDQEGNPNYRQQTIDRLMKRLQLNDLRRAYTLLKAIAGGGLLGAANTAVTWNGTGGEDPDAAVAARLMVGSPYIGEPGLNRGVFGSTAWLQRFKSLRAQSHAGGFASAALSPDQLAMLLGLDAIKVSRELYNAGGTLATTLAPVLDNTVSTAGIVLLYNAQSGQTVDDPSSIKRFVSAAFGGGEYAVYLTPHGAKLEDITVEHHSNVVVTAGHGVQMLTVS